MLHAKKMTTLINGS